MIQMESEIQDMHLKYKEKEQTASKINKKLNFLREKVTILFDNICKRWEKSRKIIDKTTETIERLAVSKAP